MVAGQDHEISPTNISHARNSRIAIMEGGSNHENKTHELKTIEESRKFSATKFTCYVVDIST